MKNALEAEIVAQLYTAKDKAGREKAASNLYKYSVQDLWKYALNRKDRLDKAVLEDLIQQCLVDLIESIAENRIELDGLLIGYLQGMLKNKILNYLRGESRARARESSASWLLEYSYTPSPEQLFIQAEIDREKMIQVDRAMEKLTEKCRHIFNLLIEGKNYFEIGQILNYRPLSVKVIVHRCKDNFREKISL